MFVGTNGGMWVYNMDQKSWHATGDPGTQSLITRQSMAGDRIYASAWAFGVIVNDSCALPNLCAWRSNAAPPANAFIRDVLGSRPDEPDWILAATSNGLIYWSDVVGDWKTPASPPNPSGDVFALDETLDGDIAFAAVEGSGVWYSRALETTPVTAKGDVWWALGNLHLPIIDLTVTDEGLYATTTNSGVYFWRLP